MIPKKIHYCWFGPKQFPELVQKCIATWKVHFRDYEFFLWNETNSPMEVPYVKDAYIAKKYAFVSDYVRFWVLYNEGGIYFDTDMFFIRSMDDLLNKTCFFGWETIEQKTISCGVIGCEKGDEFLKEIVDKYSKLHFSTDYLENLVIPRLVTSVYEKSESKNKLTIFPFDYFYPFPYEDKDQKSTFLDYATENTYGIHLWNMSWVTKYSKIVSRIVRTIKKH